MHSELDPTSPLRLTAKDTAVRLGVSERTVRRWLSAGKLVAEKRGGAYRILLDEAERVRAAAPGVISSSRKEELLELRGRYAEVCDRLQRMEERLRTEQREVAKLEAALAALMAEQRPEQPAPALREAG